MKRLGADIVIDYKKDDFEKRKALTEAGYQVLFWHYKDSLEDFFKKRPDLFKRVK